MINRFLKYRRSITPAYSRFLGDTSYSVFCGLVFVAIFYAAYSFIPVDFYEARDDGVITLSHAKNWVDYGFIGLNPSGERVEGYSAPVQFFLYTIVYGLLRVPYDLFAKVQTVGFTFLLGSISGLFFSDNKKLGLIVLSLAGLSLVNLTSFLQWHGSGMENPITHVLFISSIYILFRSTKTGSIDYWKSIILFLASISRLESVIHIAPLLVIFSVHGFVAHRSYRALKFSFLVFVLWALFHFWRFWYFGDLMPNTAYAQEISVLGNLQDLVSLEPGFLKDSFLSAFLIFVYHGGYLSIFLLYLLVLKRKDNSLAFLVAITSSLILTGLLNPVLFGPSRLDPARTTTQVAVVIAIVIPVIIYLAEQQDRRFWRVPAFCAAGLLILSVARIERYELCCSTRGFDVIRSTFDLAGRAESLPRPTVSNPDLGVMSWAKQFNIVDLGRLGSPIVAKLKTDPALADYFFDYAAPDLIESHDNWTCYYFEALFADPRFLERYESWDEGAAQIEACDEGEQPSSRFWIRRAILADSGSDERRLIDALREDLSAETLRRALAACQIQAERHCTYVARTAFRFLPEFVDAGQFSDLVAIFQTSRTREFDLYLINGRYDGQAHMAAIDYITRRHRNEIAIQRSNPMLHD